MDIKAAYKLLSASEADTDIVIKHKYRKMMRQVHPDVRPSEESAQEETILLNEAYEIIREHRRGNSGRYASRAAKGKDKRWQAEENKRAFCIRTVYCYADPFEEDIHDIYSVDEGRFYWDADLEPFPLFMLSINRKCMELFAFEAADSQCEEQEAFYRLKLFHLLIREYIRPWDTLKKLSGQSVSVEAVVEEGYEAYSLEAEIELTGSPTIRDLISDINEGDELPLRLSGDRIHLTNQSGKDVGHVSFTEDALYYVCLMIATDHKTRFRARIRKKQIITNVLPYKGRLLLSILVIGNPPAVERAEDRNLEIAELLNKWQY